MAAGPQGANGIAIDVPNSFIISFDKLVVLGIAARHGRAGGCGRAPDRRQSRLPGPYLARLMVERMPVHVHSAILDAVVIAGGGHHGGGGIRGMKGHGPPRLSGAPKTRWRDAACELQR